MIVLTSYSPATVHPSSRQHLRSLAADVEALVSDAYWNRTYEPGRMAAAHLGSTAWVVARQDGRLVATARAISDGAKCAWIYDVVVVEDLRGSGLGTRLMKALLAHEAVAGVRWVHLSTRDADPFYERLGFGHTQDVCRVPWRRVPMSLDQGRVPFPAWDDPGRSPLAS
jgi:GNAT superfamily N-acetyltransferase